MNFIELNNVLITTSVNNNIICDDLKTHEAIRKKLCSIIHSIKHQKFV